MKKIAIMGLVLLMASGLAFASGRSSGQSKDARIQITYSFWGTPDELGRVHTT